MIEYTFRTEYVIPRPEWDEAAHKTAQGIVDHVRLLVDVALSHSRRQLPCEAELDSHTHVQGPHGVTITGTWKLTTAYPLSPSSPATKLLVKEKHLPPHKAYLDQLHTYAPPPVLVFSNVSMFEALALRESLASGQLSGPPKVNSVVHDEVTVEIDPNLSEQQRKAIRFPLLYGKQEPSRLNPMPPREKPKGVSFAINDSVSREHANALVGHATFMGVPDLFDLWSEVYAPPTPERVQLFWRSVAVDMVAPRVRRLGEDYVMPGPNPGCTIVLIKREQTWDITGADAGCSLEYTSGLKRFLDAVVKAWPQE